MSHHCSYIDTIVTPRIQIAVVRPRVPYRTHRRRRVSLVLPHPAAAPRQTVSYTSRPSRPSRGHPVFPFPRSQGRSSIILPSSTRGARCFSRRRGSPRRFSGIRERLPLMTFRKLRSKVSPDTKHAVATRSDVRVHFPQEFPPRSLARASRRARRGPAQVALSRGRDPVVDFIANRFFVVRIE